jgi:NTE family protein
MPFGSEGPEEGIALALSGGGFRATLFHIGACWRLLELGVLSKLKRISSVSGGSIFAGVLAASWDRLKADLTTANYQALVVEPLRAFCRQSVDSAAIAEGALTPWESAGEHIENRYRSALFDIGLNQLPDTPIFVFNATNLQTGRSFRFSKPYMGDYLIGLIRNPTVPLAKAVAASSAFPPFLSPIILDKPGIFEPVEGAIYNADSQYTNRIYLSDGGVYDNLGLETVWNRFQTILVGDAGAPFNVIATLQTDWIRQTLRALDIATDQARALRKRALIDDFQRAVRTGTYWGINTDITNYHLPTALHCTDAIVKPLAQIRTRLNPVNDEEQEKLINWGYALSDAAVRTHVPQAVAINRDAAFPYPEHPLS